MTNNSLDALESGGRVPDQARIPWHIALAVSWGARVGRTHHVDDGVNRLWRHELRLG